MNELVTALLNRIFGAKGTGRLKELLKAAKTDDVARDAFRTSGNREQLEEAVQDALVSGHLDPDDLIALVNEVEETGGQHVYLFDLTDEGHQELTAATLAAAFPEARPSAALYGDKPTRRTYFIDRGDDGFGVKQILTSSYWELDRDQSEETATRRVQVHTLRERRTVHVALIRPDSRELEIRVDRVRSEKDDRLATRSAAHFLASLVTVLDLPRHTVPVPFTATALARMARARDETYMSLDEASDGSISQRVSAAREGTRGMDIREHEAYALGAREYSRKALNIYWRVDEEKVHTILHIAPVTESDEPEPHEVTGKVYLSAKVSPQEMRHVIDRIRHFAR